MIRKNLILAGLIVCLSGPIAPRAQSEDGIAADEAVETWIERLGSPKFSERAAATRRLQRLGVGGIAALEKVAGNGTSDAADRAMEILKQHFQSSSPQLSDAAGDALERIAAQDDHPQAAAATKLLRPKAAMKPSPNLRPQIQLAPPVLQKQRISVSVKTINGKREISVDENGRKFSFKDVDGGLHVKRPDDKGGTKTKQYPNADALKKADKEAYDKYKKYAAGNGMQIQIQLNQQGFPQAIPPGFQQPAFPIIPRAPFPQMQPRQRLPRRLAPQQNPAPAKEPEPKLIDV